MKSTHFTASLVVFALAAAGSLQAQTRAYIGEARTLEGKPIYEEHHLVRFVDGQPAERLVTYRCPDGQAFARKQVDYGTPLFAPTFRLQDQRFGYVEGFAKGDAFVQAGSAAAEEREAINAGANLVVDAGFDEFVRQHWDELQAGKSVGLEFLVPSRLSAYKFKLRKIRSETMFDAPASVFQLAVSGLLGWFADPLEAGYRDSDRRLMHFQGLTNIRQTLDSNIVAQIRFPPTREDVNPTDTAWATANAEPLTSCALGG
ncbi:MAG: hypothetical protein ACT4NL_15220 [Pseudomarimonas sp.]